MNTPSLSSAGSLGATSAASAAPLLDIEAGSFAKSFDRAPFLIGHHLTQHPLFQMESLLDLAKALPSGSVEYNAGELPIGCDPGLAPTNGLSAAETIRRIAECKSWMAIKNVENDPSYRDLLDRCLAEVARHSEAVRPGMMKPEAFIFVTSPGSITPYHMDPEHNFLLQIRGPKQMTLFDRGLVSPEQLEAFYSGAHRNMPFDESFRARSVTFDLQPGQGLHVPVAMPHYVKNGPEVSVSFSITFRTPDLFRKSEVHAMNGMLRKAGLKPKPVGSAPSGDALKSITWRAWQRGARTLGMN